MQMADLGVRLYDEFRLTEYHLRVALLLLQACLATER